MERIHRFGPRDLARAVSALCSSSSMRVMTDFMGRMLSRGGIDDSTHLAVETALQW